MQLSRLLLAPLVLVLAFAPAGCASSRKKKDYTESAVRFAIEAGPNEMGTQVRLPKSGVMLTVSPKFMFTEFDINSCEAATDELGPVLVFNFTEAGGRDLYRATATNQGRRIVTILNGMPIGARRIDAPYSGGYFLTNVELEPESLSQLAKDITRTSEEARKEMERNN